MSSVFLRRTIATIIGVGALFNANVGHASAISTIEVRCTAPECYEVVIPNPPDEPPSPGDGGGENGGGGGDGEAPPEVPQQQCDDLNAAARHLGCPIPTRIVQTVNGCGAAGGLNVPDGPPGASGLWTGACNAHDLCYTDLSRQKAQCDAYLGDEMRRVCGEFYGNNLIGRSACVALATAYEVGLRTDLESDQAFRKAQRDSTCNFLTERAAQLGCPIR